MGKELKVIGFAAVICLVCSLLLSGVYSTLKPRQDINKANDLKKKVLQAFGVAVVDEKGKPLLSVTEIASIFEAQIEGRVLDKDGKLVTDRSVESLSKEDMNDRDKNDKLKRKAFYPYYVYTDKDSGQKRYAIHISGMGLWSIVKAYLALEENYGTIAGVAFYEHGETPGLGGDVDKPAFQDQWKKKTMIRDGKPAHFRVLKPGELADESSVHGPSGATMTSKGITRFVNRDFKVYYSHFKELMNR